MGDLLSVICLFLLAGCGTPNPLGTDTTSTGAGSRSGSPTSVLIINRTTFAVNQETLRSFVYWNAEQKSGLGKKVIEVYCYPRTANVLGSADVGGDIISLYLKSTDDFKRNLATLAHELDHVRGYDHSYTDIQNYTAVVDKFYGR